LHALSLDLPILVTSAYKTEEMMTLKTLLAGASGYVPKEHNDLEVRRLRSVFKDRATLDPFITRRILDLTGPPLSPKRCARVCNMVATGFSNAGSPSACT
jgi:DNA-binding NarL/FixJ family response regulator